MAARLISVPALSRPKIKIGQLGIEFDPVADWLILMSSSVWLRVKNYHRKRLFWFCLCCRVTLLGCYYLRLFIKVRANQPTDVNESKY